MRSNTNVKDSEIDQIMSSASYGPITHFELLHLTLREGWRWTRWGVEGKSIRLGEGNKNPTYEIQRRWESHFLFFVGAHVMGRNSYFHLGGLLEYRSGVATQ